MNKVYFIT